MMEKQSQSVGIVVSVCVAFCLSGCMAPPKNAETEAANSAIDYKARVSALYEKGSWSEARNDLREWVALNPEAALDWARTIKDRANRITVTGQIAGLWAETAPEKAAKFAVGIKDYDFRAMAIDQVARSWAKGDLDAAIAWNTGIKKPTDKAWAIFGVVFELAKIDPVRASQLAETIEVTGEETERIKKSALKSIETNRLK